MISCGSILAPNNTQLPGTILVAPGKRSRGSQPSSPWNNGNRVFNPCSAASEARQRIVKWTNSLRRSAYSDDAAPAGGGGDNRSGQAAGDAAANARILHGQPIRCDRPICRYAVPPS